MHCYVKALGVLHAILAGASSELMAERDCKVEAGSRGAGREQPVDIEGFAALSGIDRTIESKLKSSPSAYQVSISFQIAPLGIHDVLFKPSHSRGLCLLERRQPERISTILYPEHTEQERIHA